MKIKSYIKLSVIALTKVYRMEIARSDYILYACVCVCVRVRARVCVRSRDKDLMVHHVV